MKAPTTFFIDRNLGRFDVPGALRSAGELVEIHFDHLADDAPDEDWIELCGRRGWLAITKDTRLMYREWERRAIFAHRARVFIVIPKNLTGPELGELLVRARKRIKRFAKETPPPFVAKVYRDGSIKLS